MVLTKEQSIATYGDLTNLTNGTLGVSYDGANFVFQIDTKDSITGIATFKTQYNLQNNETNDWTTIDQVETKITTTNFKNSQLEAAKAKKTSIDQYGDLTNLSNVNVSWSDNETWFQSDLRKTTDEETGTINIFQSGLFDFNTFKRELGNQGIATTTINSVYDVTSTIEGLSGILKTTKSNSFRLYGDLEHLNEIVVDYDGTNYTFKVGSNSLITNLANFKIELKKQGITTTAISDINDVTSTIQGLNGTLDTASAIEKASKKSIAIYGNLTDSTNTISVSFVDGAIEYTIKNQKLNFANLKEEAKKQGITTLTTEEELTAQLAGLNVTHLKRAKSIKKYGNLTDSTNTISVSFVDGAIEYTIKNQKLNFANLKEEAKKQGITTLTTEEELTAQLAGLNVTDLKRAKSIKKYGNLTDSTNTISVSFVDGAIEYTVKSNKFNFNQLKTEALKQWIILTTEKPLLKENSVLEGLDKTQLAKAISIKTYGDLTDLNNVVVDHDGTNYTFQIDEKDQIENLTDFKTELKKQIINKVSEIDAITTFEDVKTVLEKETNGSRDLGTTGTLNTINADAKKTTADSINEYGNLTSLTNGTLGVSYDGTNFVFQIDDKTAITGIDAFKTQYNLQNNETNNWTTIDQVETKITTVNFKNSQLEAAKAKKTSIDQYGDLTNLDNVLVDYNGTNYTFKISEKSLITSLANFKIELGNQGITTTTIDDIDDVVEAIIGLTGTLNTTDADAKKTKKTITPTTGESDQSDQGSESNNLSIILPIVSGVIMVIIVIGVLLKKYFKNKKNK